MEIEKDQADQTRFVCGIHPDNFAWTLQPGESFQTPEVMMVYSGQGLGAMSRCFHKAVREHICRGEWTRKRRPVLINNWEATYFDFTGDKLVSIAEDAASLGIELFVMDDGWFGKRDDDHSGLGDWFPNEKKLGCTLKELGERITATGMKFGIWFEPEGLTDAEKDEMKEQIRTFHQFYDLIQCGDYYRLLSPDTGFVVLWCLINPYFTTFFEACLCVFFIFAYRNYPVCDS